MRSYRQTDREIYNRAITSLGSKKSLKILEISCSNERSINFLKEKFPNSDIHDTEHANWNGKFQKYIHLKSLHFIDLNKDDLPYKNNYFDLIVCNQVLEHIYEIDTALDEIYRVLQNNGIFICGTPNLAALHERISLLFGFNPTTFHTSNIQLGLNFPNHTYKRTHCNGFTIIGLKRLLSHHKFKPLKHLTSEVYISNKLYIPLLSTFFKNIALSQCWISKK